MHGLIGNVDIAVERHLLDAVGAVVLGAKRRAVRVGRQLDVGVLGRKVVRDLVRDLDVVGLVALEQIARERDLLEEVLVGAVVVVRLQLGREVTELERLVPAGLEVVEGSAVAEVRRGDLGRV
jgi:hypothetical protein